MGLLGDFGRSDAYRIGRESINDWATQSRANALAPADQAVAAANAEQARVLKTAELSRQMEAEKRAEEDQAMQRDLYRRQVDEWRYKSRPISPDAVLMTFGVAGRMPETKKAILEAMRPHLAEDGNFRGIDSVNAFRTQIGGDVGILRTQMADLIKKDTELLGKQLEATQKNDTPALAELKDQRGRLTQAQFGLQKQIDAISGAKAEHQKMMNVPEGGVVFDPATGKPVYENIRDPKPVDNVTYENGTMKVGDKTIIGQYEVRDGVRGRFHSAGYDEPPRPPININLALDAQAARGTIKELPKLREGAVSAESGISRIDRMLGLIDKGAAGKMGQVKSFVAPYAEALGIRSQGLTDAQTYDLLAKTIGGSMRMEIIGPGPVSNYENQLLQKISGGGGASSEAARELLTYYREIALQKVQKYNESVEAVSEVAPSTGKLYPKVGEKKAALAPGKRPLPKF